MIVISARVVRSPGTYRTCVRCDERSSPGRSESGVPKGLALFGRVGTHPTSSWICWKCAVSVEDYEFDGAKRVVDAVAGFRRKGSVKRKRYKGTFSWNGETHIVYRSASSEGHAFYMMLIHLAKILGRTTLSLYDRFSGTDRYRIEEV